MALGEREASDKTLSDDLSGEQGMSSALYAMVTPGASAEDSLSRHSPCVFPREWSLP